MATSMMTLPRGRGAPRTRRRLTVVAPGTAAGPFTIERPIAAGGFGAVYQARAADGRRAAIKVLHAELAATDQVVARFTREVEAIRRIRHPNVVDIFDVGRLADGRPYFAMELLAGRDLGAVVARRGRLPVREALAILGPICDALAAVHARGIVHRDVKPANVILVEPGARPVLVDFGVAKLLDAEVGLTTSRQAIGTPAYMAPEQAGGVVDARADVYAVGALAFFLLTGSAPFSHDSPTMLLYLHRHARRQRASTRAPVPPAVDEVIVRAMRAEPADRYPDVGALWAALRDACDDGSLPAAPATAPSIACHLQITPADGDPEADDSDAIADATAVVHAEASTLLGAAGFVLAVDTSRSQLWVRRGGSGTDGDDGVATARRLARRDRWVSVDVSVRSGDASWRDGRPIGGALLDLWSWDATEQDL